MPLVDAIGDKFEKLVVSYVAIVERIGPLLVKVHPEAAETVELAVGGRSFEHFGSVVD